MIIINIRTIREALRGFNKLKLSQAKMPVLRCIRIRTEPKAIVLSATNLDHVLEYRIPLDTPHEAPTDFLVPVEALATACRNQSPANRVEISMKADSGDGEILIDNGTLRKPFAFDAMPLEDYPPDHPGGGKSCELRSGTVRALREALSYASRDQARYVLNSVMLDADNVVATDGKRIYHAKSRNPLIDRRILVPSVDLISLLDPDQTAELSILNPENECSNLYGLRQSPWTWIFRGVVGRYPDYSQVFPKRGDGDRPIELSPKDAEMLRKVALMGENRSPDALGGFRVHSGKLYLLTGSEGQQAVYQLEPSEGELGEDRHVFFNLRFLADVVEQGFSIVVFRGEMDPVLVQDIARTALFMPVRLNRDISSWDLTKTIKPVNGEKSKVVKRVRKTAQAPTKPPVLLPTPPKRSSAPETSPKEEDALENVVEICHQTRKTLRELAGGLEEAVKVARQARRERNAIQVRFDRLSRNIESLKQLSA